MAQDRKNRRRGPDTVIKTINILSIASWIIIVTVFIVVSIAKPTAIRTPGTTTIPLGNSSMLSFALFLMVIQVIMAVIGIFANMTRMKRKTDRLNLGLVFSGGIAIIGIIIYYVTI